VGAVVGGLDVLVHQAALQVFLMTGKAVPVSVLARRRRTRPSRPGARVAG
jgi:shikimate 5-dehydrogenase